MLKRASTPPSSTLIKMIPSLILGLLAYAVLVVADASPPQAGTTGGTGILTTPRLRFSPPTSRRRRASPLQVLLSTSRKTSGKHGGDDHSIDCEFVNSRAIQFAGAKKTTTRPSNDEVASANGSGSGFWPPWPFNHLKSGGRPADETEEEAGHGSGGGLDYKKDAKLFWRYISHRARVGARQIQQREFIIKNSHFGYEYILEKNSEALTLCPIVLQIHSQFRSIISFASCGATAASHCPPAVSAGRIGRCGQGFWCHCPQKFLCSSSIVNFSRCCYRELGAL